MLDAPLLQPAMSTRTKISGPPGVLNRPAAARVIGRKAKVLAAAKAENAKEVKVMGKVERAAAKAVSSPAGAAAQDTTGTAAAASISQVKNIFKNFFILADSFADIVIF